MRTPRRILVAMAMLALFTLAGSATATAAPQARQAAAAPCDRLDARIAGLEALRDAVASAVAALEQQIAGGGLRPRQLAFAQRLLDRLEDQLTRFDARLTRLLERQAEQCGGDGGGGDTGGGDDGGF